MKVSTMIQKVVSKLTEWAKPAAETRAPAVNEPSKGWAPPKAAAATRKGDGFESVGKPKPTVASDAEFVKGLYRQLLGREPDAEGFAAHLKGLETGQTRDQIQNTFLTSPEFAQKTSAVSNGASSFTPAGKLGPVPLEGYDTAKMVTPRGGVPSSPSAPSSFAPLSTVPDRPEYKNANIDRSSPSAAAISAATWVKQTYPELFRRSEDRNVAVEIMGHATACGTAPTRWC